MEVYFLPHLLICGSDWVFVKRLEIVTDTINKDKLNWRQLGTLKKKWRSLLHIKGMIYWFSLQVWVLPGHGGMVQTVGMSSKLQLQCRNSIWKTSLWYLLICVSIVKSWRSTKIIIPTFHFLLESHNCGIYTEEEASPASVIRNGTVGVTKWTNICLLWQV